MCVWWHQHFTCNLYSLKNLFLFGSPKCHDCLWVNDYLLLHDLFETPLIPELLATWYPVLSTNAEGLRMLPLLSLLFSFHFQLLKSQGCLIVRGTTSQPVYLFLGLIRSPLWTIWSVITYDTEFQSLGSSVIKKLQLPYGAFRFRSAHTAKGNLL